MIDIKKEALEQSKLFQYCRCTNQYKYLFHIPNGGSRHPIEAHNLKIQGVKPGVPDLFYPMPNKKYHGLFIEMKYGRNKPTEYQKQWINYLNKVGYLAVVCYSADKAIKTLNDYSHDRL